MNDVVIQVENLGKKYRLRHQRQRYLALRDVLADRTKNLARRLWAVARGQSSDARGQAPSTEDFWALKDVSFEVKQGDVVGIIGRNGAGKSTLLKILSRITEPTTGRVTLAGRVGSLLEVGTGFHPELTGRENIFLNGAILGMTKVEIRSKFDEIVAFAEVEKFLDTPVKHYSSGMYVRLAFAVAAHLEPEILIVDEVLAVGDAQFQQKCLGKMQEVANGGRTVLFVSHNMGAVQGLCKRAIWLDRGKLRLTAMPREVVSEYLKSSVTDAVEANLEQMPRVTGGVDMRFLKVELLDRTGQPQTHFEYGAPLTLRFTFRVVNRRHPYFGIEWTICDAEGHKILYNSSSPQGYLLLVATESVGRVECRVPSLNLTSGHYAVNCMLAMPHQDRIDQIDSAAQFDVIRCDVYSTGFNVDNGLGFTTTLAHWTMLEGVKSLATQQRS
jgi:lipopolysaccharide transport system ATP-binding protein